MWLKNCWQVAAFSKELGRTILARRLLNEPVIFYRTEGGAAVAMEDRCPHRLLPLSIGKLAGDDVQCGYHGLRFSPEGACTHMPGEGKIPSGIKTRIYPVVERYKLVWIWIGAPDLADPDLVPDLFWMDHPDWAVSEGYTHMDADYRLVTDNLLDLSHETYVHEATIGNLAVADSPVRVTVDQSRVVKADRQMPNIDPPPFFAMFMNYSGKIDRGQQAVYMPPGIHMTQASGCRADGNPRDLYLNRIMHLLTPETAHSCHYFWGSTRNYRLDDSELTEGIRTATSHTFEEDKVILRLQQERLIEDGEGMVPRQAIPVDLAPVQARRLLGRLIEQEQSDSRAVAPPIPIA